MSLDDKFEGMEDGIYLSDEVDLRVHVGGVKTSGYPIANPYNVHKFIVASKGENPYELYFFATDDPIHINIPDRFEDEFEELDLSDNIVGGGKIDVNGNKIVLWDRSDSYGDVPNAIAEKIAKSLVPYFDEMRIRFAQGKDSIPDWVKNTSIDEAVAFMDEKIFYMGNWAVRGKMGGHIYMIRTDPYSREKEVLTLNEYVQRQPH